MFYFIVERINGRKRLLYIYCIVLIMLTILLDQLPILLPWSIDTAFLGTFFMLIGYYGKSAYMQEIRWKMLILILAVYIICCYCNEGINISIRIYGNYVGINVIFVCMIGMAGSLLCIYLSKKLELVPVIRDIFEYIGKNTIIILSLHVTIFTIFDKILNWIGISEDINGVIYYGMGFIRLIVTVGVCYCISCVKKSWIKKPSIH